MRKTGPRRCDGPVRKHVCVYSTHTFPHRSSLPGIAGFSEVSSSNPRSGCSGPGKVVFRPADRSQGGVVPMIRSGGVELVSFNGRNRYRVCLLARVKPRFEDINPEDPVAYVLSLNLYRRHLTPSQAAMVAGRAREFYDKAAKDRQHEGQKAGGKARHGDSSLGANLPQSSDAGRSRDQAAKAVGVSGRTVDYATKVLEQGVPELVKAVDEGHMAVSTAAIPDSRDQGAQTR